MRGVFVTGTDTDVGKTYIACQIARQLTERGVRVGIYKPAASGCRWVEERLVSEDAEALWHAAGEPQSLDEVCPQNFAAPLAPPLAAVAEGKSVDPQLLRDGLNAWRDYEFVIVEGAGGLMSPLSADDFVADLAGDFGLPLVVVAANQIGVINQTLQTLITASVYGDGLDVSGVILNDVRDSGDPSCESNLEQLRKYCVPPVLGHVAHGGALNDIGWLDT